MKTRSLIKTLVLLGLAWMFILGPGILAHWNVLRNAGGYSRARFLVTGQNCIGGETRREPDGHTSTSPRYCFLEGKVTIRDGEQAVSEEMSVGSELPNDQPPGTRLPVFYNPSMPPFGVNYLNQRVLPADDLEPAEMARRWIWGATRFMQLSLGAVLIVHVFLGWGSRQLPRDPRELAIELGRGHPVLGTVLFSQGLAFLAGQIPKPAWGGAVFGIVLAACGAPVLMRRFVVFSKDESRETRGRHLFGFSFGRKTGPLAVYQKVVLSGSLNGSTISLTGAGTTDDIAGPESHEAARERAAELASYLQIELEDRAAGELEGLALGASIARRAALRTARRSVLVIAIMAALAGGALLVVDRVPSVRKSAATGVLEPFGYARQIAPLRRWALTRLETDPSPDALLALLRVANTVDAERFPEIARDAEKTLTRRSGLTTRPDEDRDVRLLAINTWAAGHLHRPLDENGGVLSWLPVAERFAPTIDSIASTDLNLAWGAWVHFAAGVLITPEQFLYAVGPALSDARPIHFAIRRAGQSFDGQPEPIAAAPDAIARNVGEALALQFWLKEGVGDNTFPEDFDTWWREWARRHRLPPPARALEAIEPAPASGGRAGPAEDPDQR